MSEQVAIAMIAGLCALLGGMIKGAWDYCTARFSATPHDNIALRKYMEGELAKVRREVRILSGKVLECERDRAVLHAELRRMEQENALLKKQLTGALSV
jgi:hypothetical protein